MHNKIFTGRVFLIMILLGNSLSLFSQKPYFIDGYHGGVWGHYPPGYSGFIVEQLEQHPNWVINMEIEPVTWDVVKQQDGIAYAKFAKLMADTSVQRRIEYVNPGYGQSYLYNISGESIIRQFAYGMKKLKEHFPSITFRTYSSEEPCFTSALPQILKSFGYKYASLKNPNTCWGGYTRAHGGELVRWIGPDGSWLYAVPRYASEAFEKNSTWQTTAWTNSNEYVNSARAIGVRHPIGMCLQDAGWRNGPWLGKRSDSSRYILWQNYFDKVADTSLATDWHVSQEDVQVSLVWGAQALQRIAQQVRHAEDKLIATEKFAAIAALEGKMSWPQAAFDEAWQNLLLAQHHDCWIVPYNGRKGETWIDKVRNWTGITERICDSLEKLSKGNYTRIINTTAFARTELVTIDSKLTKVVVPAFGYITAPVNNEVIKNGATVQQKGSRCIVETDHYKMIIDSGVIKSLRSRKLQDKEWVAGNFNSLQGNFFEKNGQQRLVNASVTIVENTPLRVRLKINGVIAGHPVEQAISLTQGAARIDCSVRIDWQAHTGIGNDYRQQGGYDAKELRKAFYDDRDKLLLLFPLKPDHQQVFKNAPFDVTESKLKDTWFTSWDSIKNNIILNWVDVTDAQGKYGLALFTDHTTAYTHGKDQPLGLVVQYAGVGLWGRNYTLNGPTTINYSLLPHAGKWDLALLEEERTKLAEPLVVTRAGSAENKTLIRLSRKGWELSSVRVDGKDLLVRVYNAASDLSHVLVMLEASLTKVTLEELNGKSAGELPVVTGIVRVDAPRFGFRTIRFHNVIP